MPYRILGHLNIHNEIIFHLEYLSSLIGHILPFFLHSIHLLYLVSYFSS